MTRAKGPPPPSGEKETRKETSKLEQRQVEGRELKEPSRVTEVNSGHPFPHDSHKHNRFSPLKGLGWECSLQTALNCCLSPLSPACQPDLVTVYVGLKQWPLLCLVLSAPWGHSLHLP